MKRKIVAILVSTILVFVGVLSYEVFSDNLTRPIDVKNHVIPPPTPPPPINNTTSHTSSYKALVTGNANDRYSTSDLTYGSVGPDLWNIISASGETIISMAPDGDLIVNSSFSNVSTESDTILGYPQIGYGYNLEDEMCGNSQNTKLVFPMSFLEFQKLNFTSDANYSFENLEPKNIPIDFSYDLWLEQNYSSCQSPTANDLEVMIWLYDQDTEPIGQPVSTFNSNIVDNGSVVNSSWTMWEGKGNTWPTVSFVLNNPSPVSSANISLNITKFLLGAGNYMHLNVHNYSLMGIEIGNEFGNEHLSENVSDWVMSNYVFTVDRKNIGIINQ